MLPERLYSPSRSEILYHYCSPEAFLEICTSKHLRFSDLYAMNDFLEMHWGYGIWERAASEALEIVGRELLDDIDEIIHGSGLKVLALASCFSRNGDVLSQWRAYTDDGKGYAIGFRAVDLVRLPVRPLQVQYNIDAQVSEVRKVILAIQEVEKNEKQPRSSEFVNACARLAFDLASLKNPAFSEEDEVRLIHLVNFHRSSKTLRLVDPGGTAFGRPAKPQPIAFNMRNGTPVAYLDLDFTDRRRANPIAEVVVGPKNGSLLTGISVFLETVGIPEVKVRSSNASYR